MRRPVRAIVEDVLAGGTVVDIDWLLWSSDCTVYAFSRGGEALYRVRFVDCFEVAVEVDEPRGSAAAWRVGRVDWEEVGGRVRVALCGTGTVEPRAAPGFPVLRCECVSVEVKRLDDGLFDRINPGWREASHEGFARPGPEGLAALMAGRGWSRWPKREGGG